MRIKWLIAGFVLLLLLGFPVTNVVSDPLQANSGEDGLSVRLSTDKERYAKGEEVKVRVEIVNSGEVPVFVPSDITTVRSNYAYLDFKISPEKSVVPGRRVFHVTHGPAKKDKPLVTALVERWIPLAPGHSYTRVFSFPPDSAPFVNIPGRYKFSGKYHCSGIGAHISGNRLAGEKEFLEALTYGSMKGTYETNSIWIEILPEESPTGN